MATAIGIRAYGARSVLGLLKASTPAQTRSMAMATEAEAPPPPSSTSPPSAVLRLFPVDPPPAPSFAYRKPPTVLTTLYKFPTLEPTRLESYPSTFLHAPLRRDILHRAIVFEGDSHRLGLASTKWRREVHGSSKKLRPQKGTGRARLGDRSSPMLRGGGVAFGPKPRDFSTKLPRKIYDLAWRTALSYRYRRGQLVVVDGAMELEEQDAGLARSVLAMNGWGRDAGRSTMVVAGERPMLMGAMKGMGGEGRVLGMGEVDVKDVLEMGRIIIEREALQWFLSEHGTEAQL